MPKLKYNAILLDLDDTLYAYKPCNEAGKKAAFELASTLCGIGLETVETQFTLARKHVHNTLKGTAASHNRLLYFHKMTELLNVNDLSIPLKLYNAFWNTFLNAMELRPGTLDFLEATSDAKLCLLTDLTALIQFRKLCKLGIETIIPRMVTSEEVGREKPYADGFLLALEKCGETPETTCMVGDNRVKDADAATALGIDAYWYTETTTKKQGRITPFNDFGELTKIITGSS